MASEGHGQGGGLMSSCICQPVVRRKDAADPPSAGTRSEHLEGKKVLCIFNQLHRF